MTSRGAVSKEFELFSESENLTSLEMSGHPPYFLANEASDNQLPEIPFKISDSEI